MAAVTRLAPVFRTWPTTYRWRGTVTLGNQPTLTARWERKGDQRDESYRRLTDSHSRQGQERKPSGATASRRGSR